MTTAKPKDAMIASAAPNSTPETSGPAPMDSLAKTMQGYQSAQQKMQDGVSKAIKYWQDSLAFGQGNMAALMQSSQIMAAGLQEISQHAAETGKANIDHSVAFTKSILGAKSVKEATELQANYVKTTLQSGLAQSRGLAEATAKLSKQAAEPLAERAALRGKRILEK